MPSESMVNKVLEMYSWDRQRLVAKANDSFNRGHYTLANLYWHAALKSAKSVRPYEG